MNEVKLIRCTSAEFSALGVKSNDTLYFLTDTNEIFRGDTLQSLSVMQMDDGGSAWRPILIGADDNTNAGEAHDVVGDKVYSSVGVEVQPSTKTIKANAFDGVATKATADGSGNNIVNTYAKKRSTGDMESLIGALSSDTATPVDSCQIMTQDNNGGSNTRWYRRPVSSLWNYIKGKTDALYLSLSGGSMVGNILLTRLTKISQVFNDRGEAESDRASVIINVTNSANEQLCGVGYVAYDINNMPTAKIVKNDASYMYLGMNSFGSDKNIIIRDNGTIQMLTVKANKIIIGNNATIGSASNPVYINNGVPTAVTDLKAHRIFNNATSASGSNAVAMGYSSIASAQSSVALGAYTKASTSYQAVVGRYNKETNSLFIVGNGTSESSRQNVFEVGSDGSIYLYKNNVKYKLDMDAMINSGLIKQA